ncbi:competence protein ComK [Neobacillus muris]|uniref:competence protein ComK n=1 Tax=Neobacillus muris TaxID=2941334 RepID=UPI00203CBD95|nr:competence protein ComK [Neobacillus muris]
MELKYEYLINGNTVLFYGKLNENGEMYTVAVEGEEMFMVAMSPIQLIDRSLIRYGSSFKGALKSSSMLLGENKKMYPIKMDASLDIWLFPSQSYKKDNCVWFALNHVKNTQALGQKFTLVYLSYGHQFEIAQRESSFRNKRQTAKDLKDMINQNTQNSWNYIDQPKKGIMIIEKKGGYKCSSLSKKNNR